MIGYVYIIFLHRNGTVKGTQMITDGVGGGPPQRWLSRFGSTVAGVGDFDKDGIPDLAVTAGDADSGNSRIHILFLNTNGTVRVYSTIGIGIRLIYFTSK
jgi:hypothetical protein